MMRFLPNAKPGRRGSALIITILTVSVISSVSFMVSALAISEFRKAGILQDSIAAYYAAESGIEQGLLQYRLWHDAELSKEVAQAVGTLSVPVSPTESSGLPQRIPLLGQTSFYDLKMWYKGLVIGGANQAGNPELGPLSKRVFRDSALEINGEGAKSLRLAWAPEGGNTVARTGGLNALYFVEVVATGLKSGRQQTERTVITNNELAVQPYPVTFGLDTVQTIRIKPWDMNAMRYSLTVQNASGQNMNFDNQVSYIESVGTAGKAKRTLRIGVSRSSGTALESQDFLFYAGDSPIILQ